MSWSSPAAPTLAPTRLPPVRAGELAYRTFDMTVPLTAAKDTIAGVVAIDVARVDGNPTGANDLEIYSVLASPIPDPTGMMVNFWVRSDVALIANGTVDYHLTFTANLASGGAMIRDGYLAVTAPLGPTQ